MKKFISLLLLANSLMASQQAVNVGTNPNDKTGDPIRNAYTKLNANDAELYADVGFLTTNGTDLSAVSYYKYASVGDVSARQRINSFIIQMKTNGLWSSMVDGVILSSTYQTSSTNPVTLKGIVGTNSGGASYATNGFVFSGTQWCRWEIPNLTPVCTIFSVITCASNGVLGQSPWSVINSGGRYGASTNAVLGTLFEGGQASVWDCNGTTFSTAANWSDRDGVIMSQWDPRQHSYALSSDNATIRTYVDGITNAGNAAAISIVNPLNSLMIGESFQAGNLTGPFYGNVELVLIFNRVLSDAEIISLESAVRWLDYRQKNIVFYGDSRTEWAITSDRVVGYPEMYMRNDRIANNAWWQEGASGRMLVDMFGYKYNSLVHPRAVGGPVKEAALYLWAGINDWIFETGNTGDVTNIFSWWTNICTTARNDGFKVYASTEPALDSNLVQTIKGISWKPLMDSNRVQFNNMVISNWPAYCDGLYRRDLTFPHYDTNLALDGLHPNQAGRQRIIDEISGNPHYTVVDGSMVIVSGTNTPPTDFTNSIRSGSLWLKTDGSTYVLTNNTTWIQK